MGQSRPLLVYVHPFQRTQININWKSIHGVLGTWTWGGRMEGADESAELWRHAVPNHIVSLDFRKSWRSDIQVYSCSFRHFKTKSHWPSYIDSSYLTRFISSQKSPGQICQIDSLWHNILSNLVWQRYLGLRKLTRKLTSSRLKLASSIWKKIPWPSWRCHVSISGRFNPTTKSTLFFLNGENVKMCRTLFLCHVSVTYFLIGMQGPSSPSSSYAQRVCCYSQKEEEGRRPLNLLTKHSHFICSTQGSNAAALKLGFCCCRWRLFTFVPLIQIGKSSGSILWGKNFQGQIILRSFLALWLVKMFERTNQNGRSIVYAGDFIIELDRWLVQAKWVHYIV